MTAEEPSIVYRWRLSQVVLEADSVPRMRMLSDLHDSSDGTLNWMLQRQQLGTYFFDCV
jgi:hypothetical protein